jgi:hypothetical protein
MLRTVSAALIAATLLAACATFQPVAEPPAPIPLPRFDGARPPAPGQARLYVFRPKFEDQALQDEQPVLRIGHAGIAPLPEATYAELQVPPGRHTLSLLPPEGGSDLWRTSMTLQLGRDSITFLALWMDDGFEEGSSPADAAEAVLVVLPVGNPAETTARLRVQRVAPEKADDILRKCCGQVYPPVAAPGASPAGR